MHAHALTHIPPPPLPPLPQRPFACEEPGCGKRYIRENHLKRHQLVHSGEKPFVCTHSGCTAAYHTSYHLKRHVRVHEKAKSYVVCSKLSRSLWSGPNNPLSVSLKDDQTFRSLFLS